MPIFSPPSLSVGVPEVSFFKWVKKKNNLWGDRAQPIGGCHPLLCMQGASTGFQEGICIISGFVLQEHKITESLRLEGTVAVIYPNPSALAESPSSAPSPDVS